MSVLEILGLCLGACIGWIAISAMLGRAASSGPTSANVQFQNDHEPDWRVVLGVSRDPDWATVQKAYSTKVQALKKREPSIRTLYEEMRQQEEHDLLQRALEMARMDLRGPGS